MREAAQATCHGRRGDGFTGLLGYAYARTGRFAEGLGLLEEAVTEGEIGIRPGRARWLSLQSEALLLAGQVSDAWSIAQRGLEGARARGERGEGAFCLRALSEAEAYGDPWPDEVPGNLLNASKVPRPAQDGDDRPTVGKQYGVAPLRCEGFFVVAPLPGSRLTPPTRTRSG